MSLDDESQTARFCKTYFAQSRDEILQCTFWSFAITRVSLSQLSEAPLSGWRYQYQLPSDYIRIMQANGCWAFDSHGIFNIEGDRLLTNMADADTNTLPIRYIRRETNPALFHPLFIKTLAFELAANVAKPLTGDQNLAQTMRANAALSLAKAARTDACEQHPRLKPAFLESQLVNARRSYSGGWGGRSFR